ncbi:MAG: hypothetical protein JRL30_28540 [Deltaproteobacteria bacterium]|nr:hypothetical protein [Deltaproteobacteria bacterium]
MPSEIHDVYKVEVRNALNRELGISHKFIHHEEPHPLLGLRPDVMVDGHTFWRGFAIEIETQTSAIKAKQEKYNKIGIPVIFIVPHYTMNDTIALIYQEISLILETEALQYNVKARAKAMRDEHRDRLKEWRRRSKNV